MTPQDNNSSDVCLSKTGLLYQTIPGLQASLLRLCLVRAIEDGQQASVLVFFHKYGEDLRNGPEAVGWEPWFAVPFLKKPQKDPQFQVAPCATPSFVLD